MTAARKQFAEALAFQFRERRISHQDAARRARVSIHDVARWLEGALVPAAQPWEAMSSKWTSLRQLGDSWRRAREEEKEERNLIARSMDMVNGHNNHQIPTPPRIGSNLGDKIRSATSPAPDAAPTNADQADPATGGPKNPGGYARAARDLGVGVTEYASDGRARAPAPAGGIDVGRPAGAAA